VAFGGILRESFRTVDLAGRYGGDEFLMVFPDTRANAAAVSLERVRARFAAMRIGPGSDPIACSATFGLADFDPEVPDMKTLVARADQALYQAKAQGRNRLWIYGDESSLPGFDSEATVQPAGGVPEDSLSS
jgi:diguanylate cyclase (GGDEF)-like protein